MIVNGLGVLVHLAVLAPAMQFLGMAFAAAQLLATIASMYFNYAVNNLITYNDASLRGLAFWRGFVKFGLLCSLGVFANVGVASMIYREFHNQFLIVPAIAGGR